jgi:hypothetical protein
VTMPGLTPAEPPDLTPPSLFLVLCLARRVTHGDSDTVTATGDRGVVPVPAADLGVLVSGSVTAVPGQATVLPGDSGSRRSGPVGLSSRAPGRRPHTGTAAPPSLVDLCRWSRSSPPARKVFAGISPNGGGFAGIS